MNLFHNNKLFHGYQKRQFRWLSICIVLSLLVIILMSASMLIGNTYYSPSTIFRVLCGEQISGATFAILTLRLPRTLAGFFCGAAFGLAGYIFQSLLRNPLASPDIIGVSSATSTAAVFCTLILGFTGNTVSIISVLSGILVAILIYLLSYSKGSFSQGKMILIGIGIQAITRALTNYMLTKAAEFDVQSTMRWLNGSLNSIKLGDITVLAVIVFGIGALLLFFSSSLEIIRLGEEKALTLGINLKLFYSLSIVCAVILVAFSTAISGPIASVAFLSGPIATRLCGHNRCGLLPSALVGAVLVLSSDLIGQNLFPVRYPVGVITGILGAPYLIYLLIKMNQKGRRT
jgi:iron complex transport system permease protein